MENIPELTKDQVYYFAKVITDDELLLKTITILIEYDNDILSKQQLMKELDCSQIPMEKVVSKLEGMTLLYSPKAKSSKFYLLKLSENGRKVAQLLHEEKVIS